MTDTTDTTSTGPDDVADLERRLQDARRAAAAADEQRQREQTEREHQ